MGYWIFAGFISHISNKRKKIYFRREHFCETISFPYGFSNIAHNIHSHNFTNIDDSKFQWSIKTHLDFCTVSKSIENINIQLGELSELHYNLGLKYDNTNKLFIYIKDCITELRSLRNSLMTIENKNLILYSDIANDDINFYEICNEHVQNQYEYCGLCCDTDIESFDKFKDYEVVLISMD